MKRRFLSLMLVLCMVLTFLPATAAAAGTYSDTDGHWAEDAIERWSGYGIVQGSNNSFDPNGPLTRAQMATILARLLNLPAAPSAGFTDVAEDAWYADAIDRCYAAGILLGSDGKAMPDEPITREQAMVMLCRALGIPPVEDPDLGSYADAANVSAWAAGYVAALIEAGIVSGVTADTLAPQNNIDRASTVTILDRAISVYAGKDGATVDAKDAKGLILIVGKNVTVKNAPAGATVIVTDGASGLTVNGKKVADDQTYTVPKTTSGGGGGGGSTSGGSVTPSVPAHDHGFASAWTTTTTEHWYAATCTEHPDEKGSYGLHSGNAATCEAPQTCSVCSYVMSPALGHSLEYKTTANGKDHYECSRTGCSKTMDVDTNKVAVIGETGYDTLEAAVAAANSTAGEANVSILLLKDTTVSAQLTISRVNVTLDGNGKTITATGSWSQEAPSKYLVEIDGSGSGLFNVTLNCGGAVKAWGVQAYQCENVSLTRVNITNVDPSVGVALSVNGAKVNADTINVGTGEWGSINIDTKTESVPHFTLTGDSTITGNFYTEKKNGPTVVTAEGYKCFYALGCYAWAKSLPSGYDGLSTEIDGVKVYFSTADDLQTVVTNNADITVYTAAGLAEALKYAPSQRAAFSVTLANDITLSSWTSVNGDYKTITINGAGKKIIGLTAPLFETCGISDFTAKALTFENPSINITAPDNTGAGVLVGNTNQNAGGVVTVDNCHIIGGSVKAYKYAGGFIGHVSGGQTPSASVVIKNSTVTNTVISTTDSSAGGLIGHTFIDTTIEQCKTLGTTSVSCAENRENNNAKAGWLVGTVNAGTTSIKSCSNESTGTLGNTNALAPLVNGMVGRSYGTIMLDGKQWLADGVLLNSDSEYEISSVSGLTWLAEQVDGGNDFAGKTVKLMNDVDFENAEFSGIGKPTVKDYPDYAFSGTFNGNGKEIKNMTIGSASVAQIETIEGTSSNRASYGFFNTLCGTVKDLKLTNVTVKSTHYAGVVAGYSTANVGMEISDCQVSGSSVISKQATVNGALDDGDKVGGIIGYCVSGDKVTGNTVTGTTLEAFRDIGGIVGGAYNGSVITGNRVENVTLTISSNTHDTIGEIVGRWVDSANADSSNTHSSVTIKRGSVVKTADELAAALAKGGNVTIDADITVTGGWTSARVPADVSVRFLTIYGSGHSISGLNMPLLGHNATQHITIKDLTIKNSNIGAGTEANTYHSGAFVSSGDNTIRSIVLNNCHAKDVNVTANAGDASSAGILVGYAYTHTSDGQTAKVEITNCTVTGGSVTNAHGNAAGIIGMCATGVAGDSYKIENCTVSGCKITGEKTEKTGTIIGTVNNNGTLYINDTSAANCKTASGETEVALTKVYGRVVGDNTKLIIDGKTVIADGVMLNSTGEYEISSVSGLEWLSTQVNGGNDFAGKTVKLTADIDLNNKAWTPIGKDEKPFKGTFDGQDHIIKNLKVDLASQNNVGLFGFTQIGEIKNLSVENAIVKGHLNVGVVAGSPYTSKYTNITVCGTIKVDGYAYVGGVGGKNAYADWTNITVNVDGASYVKANSVSDKAYRTYVGGVIGFMGEGNHTFENVKSNINVTGSTRDVGGIAGLAHYGNTFKKCSSSGNVTLECATVEGGHLEIGGIAGVWMNSASGNVTFTNCSFTGTLSTALKGTTESAVDKTSELTDQHKITGAKYYKDSDAGVLTIN